MSKKKIEVVSGNGDNLNISSVYNKIGVEKTTNKISKRKKVIIPKEKK